MVTPLGSIRTTSLSRRSVLAGALAGVAGAAVACCSQEAVVAPAVAGK